MKNGTKQDGVTGEVKKAISILNKHLNLNLDVKKAISGSGVHAKHKKAKLLSKMPAKQVDASKVANGTLNVVSKNKNKASSKAKVLEPGLRESPTLDTPEQWWCVHDCMP